MSTTPLILMFKCEKLCSSPGFTTDNNLLFKLGHFEGKSFALNNFYQENRHKPRLSLENWDTLSFYHLLFICAN